MGDESTEIDPYDLLLKSEQKSKPRGKTIESIPLNRDFINRYRNDSSLVEQSRQRGSERWKKSSGKYSSTFFYEQEEFPEDSETDLFDLQGSEVVYFDIIKQKLQERQNSQDKSAVILADIGGMYAATWCKLALHFQNEIHQGRLKLVVTNLALDDKNIKTSFDTEMREDPFDKSTQQSFLAAKDLIVWERMNVSELWEKYKGQIDIAHENMSLAHSTIPDIDLPLVGQTLREDGLFVSKSRGSHQATSGYRKDRIDGVQSAFEQSIETMDSKYHRLLKGKTYAQVWSPDANSVRYFKDPKEYPPVIKYNETPSRQRED